MRRVDDLPPPLSRSPSLCLDSSSQESEGNARITSTFLSHSGSLFPHYSTFYPQLLNLLRLYLRTLRLPVSERRRESPIVQSRGSKWEWTSARKRACKCVREKEEEEEEEEKEVVVVESISTVLPVSSSCLHGEILLNGRFMKQLWALNSTSSYMLDFKNSEERRGTGGEL
ncbi:hypothetical protein FQA47_004463 [Oryzias melastigma]|uniref:Uncharacterized protein n=1 Tax=Oryzias melastigma TaxID=30732 RepID=A0A834FN50_ORYME|nr:hypothetical protein FQA47_004463 [Oryzias melastigma]